MCFWHKLISSQPRYDRFDTSAYKKHIKFYGILIENCLLTSRKSSLQIPKKQGFSRVYMNRIGTKPSFFRVSPVMTASIPLRMKLMNTQIRYRTALRSRIRGATFTEGEIPLRMKLGILLIPCFKSISYKR